MDAMGDIAACDPPEGGRLTDEQRDALVVELVRLHADGLLRLARRHSLCADDAQDAYQRGLEILLRHAHRLDPERARVVAADRGLTYFRPTQVRSCFAWNAGTACRPGLDPRRR